MKKRLKNYLTYLEGIDYMGMSENEAIILRTELLIQIGFFQHERLIHLIVTVTFAILTVILVIGCLAWPSITLFLLTGLFFILLVPYIGHYYFLENDVQKLYEYYDRISNHKF